MRGVKILSVVLMTIPFALCWYLYYADRIVDPMENTGKFIVVILYLLLYTQFARIYDAYLLSQSRISEIIYSQVLSAIVTDGFACIIIFLLSRKITNFIPGILCAVLQCIFAAIWAVAAHKWYFSTHKEKPSAIVYKNEQNFKELISEYGLEKKFEVKKVLRAKDCVRDLSQLEGLETVFLSDLHSHERNIILKYCVEHKISVYVIPRIGDVIMSGAKNMHMFHLPMLSAGRYDPSPEYLLIKRCFDIVVAGIATIVLSPIMIITAIAIKANDHGPVFYKQRRLTKDGKEFNVLKFRSMRVDAEAVGGARLSSGDNDPRITSVGRFIRKVRIDELPQLFNILEGSMSIVGPRPERPEIAAQYEEVFPEFRLRLQAKAGLTGYAQVYGKYNTTPYNKLRMDLMYIAHPSFVDDLEICFATVKILFMPESTEGVAVNQTTAMEQQNEDSESTE